MQTTMAGHFKDGVFYVEDINSIKQPPFTKSKSAVVAEKQVDNDCKNSLVSIGFEEDSICFDKTNIKNIDGNIPTKSLGGVVKASLMFVFFKMEILKFSSKIKSLRLQ